MDVESNDTLKKTNIKNRTCYYFENKSDLTILIFMIF